MIAGPALSAGAAYGAVKSSLNGTREDVKTLKEDVKSLHAKTSTIGERVARIEGMLMPAKVEKDT